MTSLTSAAIAGALAADISGSSNIVSASAAAGQSGSVAFDAHATQIVLSSAGMDVKNTSAQTIASFGASAKLFGGANNTADFAEVNGDGLTIVANSETASIMNAGGTTIMGGTATASLNAGGLALISAGVTGSLFSSTGAEIYGAADKNERVTISPTGVSVIANNITGSFVDANGMEIYGASNKHEKVMVNSTGVTIMANNITGSSFTAATASMFGGTDTEERVEITDEGMKVYAADAQVASFGATTAIGALEEAGSQLQIDSTGKLSVLSGSTTIFEVGTQTISEPSIGEGNKFQVTDVTRAVMNAASMSAQFVQATNLVSAKTFTQDITNLDSTQQSAFTFTESASAENNGNQVGNFKVNHYNVHNPAAGATSDSEPPFQFNATYASNVGNSISMSRFTGGVLDLNVLIEPKSGSTLKPADKEFAALMIQVDDNTPAAPHGDGYSFIHAKGSTTGSTVVDRFQVSSSGDVLASGNITAFGTAFSSVSDRTWKKDIETFSGSLDKILELRPRKFKWKKDDTEDYGFIAQEVEKILPHIVRSSRIQ